VVGLVAPTTSGEEMECVCSYTHGAKTPASEDVKGQDRGLMQGLQTGNCKAK